MAVDVVIRSEIDKRSRFPVTVEVLDEQGGTIDVKHCEAVRLDADEMKVYLYRCECPGGTCEATIPDVEFCDWEGWWAPATSSEEQESVGDSIAEANVRAMMHGYDTETCLADAAECGGF